MPKNTHLLVCNIEYPPIGGGAGPVSSQLVNHLLSRHNYTVDVVTMGCQDLPQKEKIGQRLTIRRIPSFRSDPLASYPWQHLIYIKRAQSLISKLHQSHPFDLCHAHFLVPTGILAMRIKQQLNLPYIVTAHGTDVPGHNPNRFTLMHRFTKPLIKNIINHAAATTSPSNYLKQQIISNVGSLNPNQITVINNGINTNRFTPLNKQNYILSTGRLIPGKGFKTLINAVKDENFGWPVHILGQGILEDELKDMASTSKIKIIFHGWLDNQSKQYKKLIGQAGIFAMTSAAENASMGLLEALSSGCATVVGQGSGSGEMVAQAGMTVKYGDVESLKQILFRLTGNSKLRRRIQIKARKRAQSYSWPRITQNYHRLIQSTIES